MDCSESTRVQIRPLLFTDEENYTDHFIDLDQATAIIQCSQILNKSLPPQTFYEYSFPVQNVKDIMKARYESGRRKCSGNLIPAFIHIRVFVLVSCFP